MNEATLDFPISCLFLCHESGRIPVTQLAADEAVVSSPHQFFSGERVAISLEDHRGYVLIATEATVSYCSFEPKGWKISLFFDQEIAPDVLLEFGIVAEQFLTHRARWIGKLFIEDDCQLVMISAYTQGEIHCHLIDSRSTVSSAGLANLCFVDPETSTRWDLVGIGDPVGDTYRFYPQINSPWGLVGLLSGAVPA